MSKQFEKFDLGNYKTIVYNKFVKKKTMVETIAGNISCAFPGAFGSAAFPSTPNILTKSARLVYRLDQILATRFGKAPVLQCFG